MAGTDELVAQARERSGLSDFGTDGWQEGLVQLLAAARSERSTRADLPR